jgi:plasmid stabilization system protein ParE
VKKLRLVLSEAVAADIVEQADWYEEQSGPTLAQRWETAVTSTLLRVVENPQAGSLCTFSHAELSKVRRVLIPGFPKHLANVPQCASTDCAWLFLDSTKNHRRRWCEMKTCGNRAKPKRYYQRQQRES